MRELEQLVALFVAAVVLAAAARRVGAPYPVFLALGGALLAVLPIEITFSLPPDLVLALFVAPVLVDAAYDTSVRDLRANWLPVASLVVIAVGLTTAAVAVVAQALVPGMPLAAAVALGAVVAPPDAVAATAVLRPLQPPQRLLTVLEGESLLNDASALLIYRLAVAAAAGGFAVSDVAPAFLLAVVGSLVAGPVLAGITMAWTARVEHVPTAIILQFVTTFGVWMLAEAIGLSGVLTTVCFAMWVARTAPARTPARSRIPSYAVWETVVFAVNILAFVFIGLQVRPIVGALGADERGRYMVVALAVLATVVVVRIVWHMTFNAFLRWREGRDGFRAPQHSLRATAGSGLVVSWAGMRGIVSLAAALALPPSFPYRDLVLLTAFAVVVGTLVIQGLTIGPLLRALDLRDDDPVGHETATARERALGAALARLDGDQSALAGVVRQQFMAYLAEEPAGHGESRSARSAYADVHRAALQSAREVVLAMRDRGEIGDDAFHRVEEELDWLEMAAGADARQAGAVDL